jgi:predicted RNA-binding protein with RPS1 domain
VTGKNGSAEKGLIMIEELTHEFVVGEIYEGPVTKMFDFGVLVQLNSSTEGMVHVSEMAPFRINNVSDVIKEGEVVKVVVKELGENGKISLSIKNIDPEFVTKKGITATNQNPARQAPDHHDNKRRPYSR